MSKNINAQKGKKGFQPTHPKASSPSVPPSPQGFQPISTISSPNLQESYNKTYTSMQQLFRENEETLTELTQKFEAEGMPTSDAQAAAEAELYIRNRKNLKL